MQAAIVTGKEKIEVLEFPEPRPLPGAAVVRVTYCGVCGTDVHSFQSGEGNPAICGHEITGVVTAVGPGVDSVRDGDRVVAGVQSSCGQCPPCRAGDANNCTAIFAGIVGARGVPMPHGGFAPAITLEAARLLQVPSGLSDIQAALVEPVAVALHGVRRTPIRLGDTVVVLGAGPIGLLTMQCARAAGAGRVIVVEPADSRAALASELGASLLLRPGVDDVRARIWDETGGLGPQVVFECAGISPTIQQAVDLVRRGGLVTLIGLSSDLATIDPRVWLSKEITFRSAVAYLREEFEIAMGLIGDGRVRVEPLHTATVGLDGMQQAFASLATAKSQVKILVDPHR